MSRHLSAALRSSLSKRHFSSSFSAAAASSSASAPYIVGAARTPTGSFLGSLSSLSATELGTLAAKAALQRSGVDVESVSEVFFGSVLQAGLGQAPARQVALNSGLPQSVPCTTVNKVCASGMKAATLGAQTLTLAQAGLGGDAGVVLAGGMESMSNAPYYVLGARSGLKFGPGQLVDGMQFDGLTDAFDKHAMGVCGDVTAQNMKFSRQEQDDFAAMSYERAQAATSAGHFGDEIAPVTIKTRKGETVETEDEEYKNFNKDKVPSLRPAFGKDGTVTAANASKLSDGASALVLASATAVEQQSLKPLARIVGYADAAAAPIDFPTAPAKAVPRALKMAGLSVKDVDFWEVNEAFSVVVLANAKILGVPLDRVNVNGGAVSLGHPIGSSGSRIVVTLAHILKQRGARYGCASICNGGGGATAIVIENVQ